MTKFCLWGCKHCFSDLFRSSVHPLQQAPVVQPGESLFTVCCIGRSPSAANDLPPHLSSQECNRIRFATPSSTPCTLRQPPQPVSGNISRWCKKDSQNRKRRKHWCPLIWPMAHLCMFRRPSMQRSLGLMRLKTLPSPWTAQPTRRLRWSAA